MQDEPYRQVPINGRAGVVAHALVDPADYEWAMERRWCLVCGANGRYYAGRGITLPNGRRSTIALHRELLDLQRGDGTEVDHVNGDPLDNRRRNLEITTHAENMKRVHGRTTNVESLSNYVTRLEARLAKAKDRLEQLQARAPPR